MQSIYTSVLKNKNTYLEIFKFILSDIIDIVIILHELKLGT